MTRLILRMAAFAAILLCMIVVGDWIVWRIRTAHGNGIAEVTISQVSAAELKSNKEEYYFDGDITITCARSLFPPLTSSGWMPPCWYLRRHTLAVTRI